VSVVPLRHHATRVLGLFVLGMVPGLISFSNLFGSEEVTPNWQTLAFYALPWLVWAYYTPLIRIILRRWAPLENAGKARWFVVHTLTFSAGWVGNEVVGALLRAWSPWPKYQPMGFVPFLLMEMRGSFVFDLLAYSGACGVIYALEARSRLRAQEMTAARLEAQLARAQLEALRVQLHPHFLFNTLNAISMMARKGETDGAVRMLAGLSDLLRLALASVGKAEVPLRLELDFLERYLALQQIRFSDRLQVRMHISPEALDARVPSLVLQPLAENAVRHGLSPSDEGGLLEIGAEREGADLVLSVRDTGVGLAPESERRRGGVGLQNVRARLAVLYPDAHTFTLENHPGGGTLAVVCIPFHNEALVDA
jgi:two-component system, LytTR family, sensor kinase